ncbi:MAG TPA: hypothetical protein VFE62_23830 [Gemmataceae bacterium]|nr:hypothetical protein [Gemmataceae bacterium]
MLLDGVEAIDCTYGIFKTRMDAHEYRKLNMKRIDTADIFEPWGNSTLAEDYERYLDDTVDDLPPTTVITRYEARDDGKLLVYGIAADNGTIKRVTVNEQEATPLAADAGLENWKIALQLAPTTQTVELLAVAEDKKGNLEPRPHRMRADMLSEPADRVHGPKPE